MRFAGKLDKWNDERGFGFIAPTHGNEPLFVHISAFVRYGRRPEVGDAVTFEVESRSDGKKQAVNVQRPGVAPSSVIEKRRAASVSRTKTGLGARHLVPLLLVAGIGAVAYWQFMGSASSRAGAADVRPSMTTSGGSDSGAAGFRCDGRTHCSQMTSCGEAKFFLRNCPGTTMDGDGDGIPCEQQWCTGPLSR